MNSTLRPWAAGALLAALVALVAGCGGNGTPRTAAPSATATPTRTPTTTVTATLSATPTSISTSTPTPPQGQLTQVTGLVVVNRSLTSRAGDTLGAPPPGWGGAPEMATFDRALSNADWVISGLPEQRGVTAADGRFTIVGLPPGRFVVAITKTLDGNLVPLTIPVVVGSDGNGQVVAEVAVGLVRLRLTYRDGDTVVREVRGPYGNWAITRDGKVTELGDPSRTLVDPDGDGHFDILPCASQLWECGADGDCGADRVCGCSASCPACEDCDAPVCVVPGQPTPYRCNDDGSCAQLGDRCVCVSSCPACDDCRRGLCVPDCVPVDIRGITISGPAQVVAGRQAQVYATAMLSDGSHLDVTHLVDWQSSDGAIASVDAWGTVTAATVGAVQVTATLGTVHSAPWSLEVVEQPALRRISVQNTSCFCGPVPLAAPAAGAGVVPCLLDAPAHTDILPVPSCRQVVLIGASLQFTAVGEFADGSYEDLTTQVEWRVTPAAVGDMVDGLFTARQPGSAQLTAALDAVASDPTEVRVVTESTLESLSIYPANWGFNAVAGGPLPADAALPCYDCGASITVLRGDQVHFQATGHYDTGEWRDLTDQVTWRSSDAAVATIDAGGVMAAVQGGDTVIDAVLAAVTSNTVSVRVVNEATLLSISTYQEGNDRVVAKGDQRFFHATGYYDIGISRDVTAEATWLSSDEQVGGFDRPGTFTARAAGTVEVRATLAGQQSGPLSLEVFETSELDYCDPAHINRAMWSDTFNRVTLESDCAHYDQPGLVTLRYTVTETQPHGGIFDPCLDLFVFQGGRLVRTIREEGCGDPFLPAGAPARDEAAPKYQLRAFWDLKDDQGNPVPDGTYTIYGRFYLYYDPVVSIDVGIGDTGAPPLTPTQTATPFPVCTAPLCQPGEVYFCPSRCPGGCGTGCATPTPTPNAEIEGVCFRGPAPEPCSGSSFSTSQVRCCAAAQLDASLLTVWWCPAAAVDPSTDQCGACVQPCEVVAMPGP